MKKFWIVFLCLLTILCSAGCEALGNRATLGGTVVEIYDASLLVETEIGPCVVYLPEEVTQGELGLAVGDTVEIVHSGEIAESYPMQIHHVYAIKRVETTKTEN